MKNQKEYMLRKDRPIGHELIVHGNSLFGRRLELRTISYNELMERVDANRPYYLDEQIAFYNVREELKHMKDEVYKSTFGITKGKAGVTIYVRGITKTSQRIRKLEFDFTERYLKKAGDILNALGKRKGKWTSVMRR